MKTAIKIVSGVLVVALVVVAALAIAGVFNVKTNDTSNVALAENDPSVVETQMFRGFAADTVLYIKAANGASVGSGSPNKYISVKNNEDEDVTMVWQDKGVQPKGGWIPGMYYRVSLSAGYEFVNEEFAGRSSFDCIVASRESTDKDVQLSKNVIFLSGNYTVTKNALGDAYTLTVDKYDSSIANPVFVEDKGLDSKSYKMVAGSTVVSNGGGYKFTVTEAAEEDVYDALYINKSYSLGENDFNSWVVDEQATEASIRSCDWFLAAVDAIYGTSLDSGKKSEYIKVSFSPSFEAGSPSKVKLNISVKFSGITKTSSGERDKDSFIEIKLANTFTPVFDVHIQNEDGGKAFDASLSLDVDTTAAVTYTFGRSYTSYGDNANDTLEAIAAKVANVVKAATGSKMDDSGKPYMFAKWIIPIGALPICIEDNLGVEIKASFSGQIGVSATNHFHTEVGVVYANGDVNGFGNVDDKFHFEGIGLAGIAGVKVGLVNEIGISAYGTISVDLGLHAGVYCDIAGRLQLEGDDIIKLFTREGDLNIIPAYYLEAGIYVDLTVAGKLFSFTIAQKTLLAKKFPLYTLGHKYLPVEGENNPFVDETIYMESSYYYFDGWTVNARNIQDIVSAPSKMTLDFGEFDYEVGPNLRLDGNRLVATKAGEFESYVIVTSKVNKQLSKKVTIVKNPELPTAIDDIKVAVYDKNDPSDVYYGVLLNGSKLIGVSIDEKAIAFDPFKDYEDGSLKIAESIASKLSYGSHKVVVESSKGYLNLELRVISSADVVVDTSVATYDKAASSAVQWNMALQGNAIASVVENGMELSADAYSYRDGDGKFVINASYWDGKAVGTYSEIVTLADGKWYELKVNVVDNRAAKLLTSEYTYIAESGEDLAIQVELFENDLDSVKFDGITVNTQEAVIESKIFDGIALGKHIGYINGMEFSVNVVKASNVLIIPVQTGEYYKSENNDVKFQVKKMASGIKIANCDGLTISDDCITIGGDFLAKQKGEVWSGVITGADNGDVTISIALINDLKPVLLQSEYTISGSDNVLVKWDLQGYAIDSVSFEGVVGKKTNDGLNVSGAELDYGVTTGVIYTPVNELTFSITRSGTPSFKTVSYALNKNSDSVVSYQLDVAHLAFDYLTVEGADILPVQYRYSDGVLTLSNDFAYNLDAGDYTIKACLSDGSVLTATLKIQGEASVTDMVGEGTKTKPYLIYTADQLANVYTAVKNSVDGNVSYKLMADIDMYGYSVEPIGTKDKPFKGLFDGNGYTISNMSISKTVDMGDGAYAIGMFGVIASEGAVQQVVLSNANVSFAQSGSISAGLIAGCNMGSINGVYINGSSISAESKSFLNIKNAYFELGAVVGYNFGGSISNVDVSASISGSVKGINVFGLQITGRKSNIAVGGVVGNFTTNNGESAKLVKNIKGNVIVKVSLDNGNEASMNGWYGATDLDAEVIASCAKRCKVSVTE